MQRWGIQSTSFWLCRSVRAHLSQGCSVRGLSSRALKYERFGIVDQVLKQTDEEIPEVAPGQVQIRFIAAPMNPADFNMIEGVYQIRPPLPAVGGNEGVAVVEKVGDGAKFKPGDWVIPAHPGFGTWRTRAVCRAEDVDYVDNTIPAEAAATVAVNPCTAWRMLHDFVQLKPGDVVVQNGANSGVGQAVIQLAAYLGLRTINIVRDRPNFKETVERLQGLGATIVVSEDAVSSASMRKVLAEQKMSKAALALNCVGGESSVEIARLLGDNGKHVTYGGMSRKPVMVPTGRLIFNDISLHGFWLSRWVAEHSAEERAQMIKQLTDLIRMGKLKTSVEKFAFDDWQRALTRAHEGFRDSKVILQFPS